MKWQLFVWFNLNPSKVIKDLKQNILLTLIRLALHSINSFDIPITDILDITVTHLVMAYSIKWIFFLLISVDYYLDIDNSIPLINN